MWSALQLIAVWSCISERQQLKWFFPSDIPGLPCIRPLTHTYTHIHQADMLLSDVGETAARSERGYIHYITVYLCSGIQLNTQDHNNCHWLVHKELIKNRLCLPLVWLSSSRLFYWHQRVYMCPHGSSGFEFVCLWIDSHSFWNLMFTYWRTILTLNQKMFFVVIRDKEYENKGCD